MPFTFSHPAIVLPITYLPKRWYSLTGLVVGSTVPDFEYFFRMNVQSIYSHTLWGIFYFDLPLGLLLTFVFHAIVRNLLIDNTPSFLSKHLTSFKTFNWASHFTQNRGVVLLSIIIGTCSHILWDSFTHVNGYFVLLFPALKSIVIKTTHFGIPIFTILQHTSSLVGMICIYFFIKALPIQDNTNTKIDFRYWLCIFLIAAIVVVLRYLLSHDVMLLGDIIITLVSGTLLATLLTSLLLRKTSRLI